MKFDVYCVEEAEGAILAHSQRITVDGKRRKLPKGSVLDASHIKALLAEGQTEVWAAKLDVGDLGEDEAAAALAMAAAGDNVRVQEAFTGRANLVADRAGLVQIDRARIDRLNAVDESLTFATLHPFEPVTEGQMLATAKIIPFGAPKSAIEVGLEILAGEPVLSIAPYQSKKIGLLSTLLPGTKPGLADKTRRVLEHRLKKSGSTLVAERRVVHQIDAVASGLKELKCQGADLLVVFSASAVVDRGDIVPAGLVSAGGEIHHFGLPVDPGNLLVLGALGSIPVIGAPNCARTPKLNGFDWVFYRLVAGLELDAEDIAAMGVGGLLKEIASRPQPRAGKARKPEPPGPRIATLLLAAGRSSRMGAVNKMTVNFRGQPLVRWAAKAARGSMACQLVVVTGHQATDVAQALSGLGASFVHNPDFAQGLSTSIAAGMEELGDDIDGALVLLGDMPGLTSQDIDRLIARFNPDEGRSIVVPQVKGQRGNPVLWGAEFFTDLAALEGDKGARELIGEHGDVVVEVETGAGVLADIDTPEALAAARVGTGF